MDAQDRLARQIVDTLTAHLAEGKRLVIPEAGRLLWSWFDDLHATRSYGDAGPNPITFAEIDAYASLMREPIEPRHVSAIRAIDDAWLKHARASQGEAKAVPPATPMTPALFDAMFA